MSITAIDMVKYPFLPQARKYISRLDMDFNELALFKEIRDRAKQRIILSLTPNPKLTQEISRHYEAEIVSYALALLYISGIGEDKLIQRFALFEAEKINYYLKNEKHVGVIIEIAKAFNWKFKENSDGSYSVPFSRILLPSVFWAIYPTIKMVWRSLCIL